MLVITGFKEKIENKLGQSIENEDLLKAIEMAKSDIVANCLIMDKDVTSERFQQVVADCIGVMRRGKVDG